MNVSVPTYFPSNGELNVAPDLSVALAGLAVHLALGVALAAVLKRGKQESF